MTFLIHKEAACLADVLGDSLERMVAIQMTAYPAHWSDEDRREVAEKHLFGTRTPEESHV